MIKAALCICFCLLIATQVNAEKIRIKDLVSFDGVRGNDLVGYGLVVGLNGNWRWYSQRPIYRRNHVKYPRTARG